MMKIFDITDGGVVVIGPAMLDRYIHCHVTRADQTAPVPVGTVDRIINYPGGAGNVAMNLRGLDLPVALVSLIGRDPDGVVLANLLTRPDIKTVIQAVPGFQTIVKSRLVDHRRQMFCRFDVESPAWPETRVNCILLAATKELIRQCNPAAIVLSDYNKGVLTAQIAREVIAMAVKRHIPVIVDPAPSNICWYDKATVLTPNMIEAAAMSGFGYAGPSQMADTIRTMTECDCVLITAGADGMFLLAENGEVQHIPAIGSNVVDTTGAGDTIAAAVAAGLCAGMSMEDAAHYARDAATVTVHKHGTAIATRHEVFQVHGKQDAMNKLVSLDTVVELVASAHKYDATVAVANGVFDIMHRGHLALFEGAAEEADFLIAMINSDASAYAVKGTHPVQSEQSRAAMVACCPQVDAVVIFSEITPEVGLRRLRPDILVKGCDYTPGTVVGADLVRSWGGKIKIVAGDYDSTSRIVERVSKRQQENQHQAQIEASISTGCDTPSVTPQ